MKNGLNALLVHICGSGGSGALLALPICGASAKAPVCSLCSLQHTGGRVKVQQASHHVASAIGAPIVAANALVHTRPPYITVPIAVVGVAYGAVGLTLVRGHSQSGGKRQAGRGKSKSRGAGVGCMR